MRQTDFLLRYTLQTFAIVLIIGILLRVLFFSSYVMSGKSMLPSVWPGDFIIAVKGQWQRLEKGQVVALRCPKTLDRVCFRRVIGQPGDRIEFKGNKLVLNGIEARYDQISPDIQSEFLDGHARPIWQAVDNAAWHGMPPVVVPPNHLYLLNDRRVDDDDSRVWGPVSMGEVESKAALVWLSLDWFDGERVRSWPRIRWSRVGRGID